MFQNNFAFNGQVLSCYSLHCMQVIVREECEVREKKVLECSNEWRKGSI